MNDQSNEDVLAELRKTDPARGVSASDALRARVAATLDAENAPTRRKTPAWVLPVAAASAVAMVIGGVYLSTREAPSAVTAAESAADAVDVQVGTPEDPAPPVDLGGAGRAADATSIEATDSAATDLLRPWGGYGGNMRFTAPAFGSAPTTADVYAVDGNANYSAETAARVASRLGVDGEPRTTADSMGWIVGSGDSLPRIDLGVDGDATVNYLSELNSPWSVCDLRISPDFDLSNATEDEYRQYEDAVSRCVGDTPLPTESDARSALSDFLEATGVDEANVEIEVRVDEYSRTIDASARQVVGNNITTLTTTVTVSVEGLLSASGPTGEVVSLGAAPIVSPEEAAARLNDAAFGAQMVSQPDEPAGEGKYVVPTAPPSLPGEGSAVPWPIQAYVIESARLGLTSLYDAEGVHYLAPAYEFTDTEGNVWSVPAIAEDALDTTSPASWIGFGVAE